MRKILVSCLSLLSCSAFAAAADSFSSLTVQNNSNANIKIQVAGYYHADDFGAYHVTSNSPNALSRHSCDNRL